MRVILHVDLDTFFPSVEVREHPEYKGNPVDSWRGPKTESVLKDLNIETISYLASAKPQMLTRLFGSWGARLHELVNGIDDSDVVEEYATKSIGRDITFEVDSDDEVQIFQVLNALAEEVHEDVIAGGFKFKMITIRIRYKDFDTHTRSKSMLFPTNDLEILKNTAKRLMAIFLRGNKKVRLIGVRVSNLSFQIAVPRSA